MNLPLSHGTQKEINKHGIHPWQSRDMEINTYNKYNKTT
jgi:hypothetical protein